MAFLIAALPNVDHDVAVFNFDRVHRNPGAGIVRGFAGLWVPLPAVPGANDFVAFDRSLAQRTATVQANVIHSGDGSVYVGDADDFIATGKFFGLAFGGEFGLGENQHSALSIQ
jgi:hypothetical protein